MHTATVRETRTETRVNLTNAPRLTNTIGRTRQPHGLRITYGARTDITRIDLVIEWDTDAELWPPAAELPAWLRQIITDHMPADVDEPEDDRPSGAGGLPIPFPAAVSSVPAGADLRGRVAQALVRHDQGIGLSTPGVAPGEHHYREADAVLPTLLASADRAAALLARTESHLSALHGSVARHDDLGENLACAGCEIRDQIAAEVRRRADEAQQGGQP